MRLAKNKQEKSDVSITFNGKEHTLEEWTKAEIAAADKDKTLNWQSAFQGHTEKSETNKKTSAPGKKFASYYYQVKKKRRRGLKQKRTAFFPKHPPSAKEIRVFFKHVWLPVMAALVVGLGLGFTMLLIFSDQGKTSVKSSAAAEQTTKKTGQGQAVSPLKAEDLPFEVSVIQGGVFSKTEQVNKAIGGLRKKGVPAIAVKTGGQTAVYIGLMTNDSAGSRLTNYYKKRKVGYYEKKWQLSVAEHPLVLKNRQLADFIGKGRDILKALLGISGQVTPESSLIKAQTAEKLDKLKSGWQWEPAADNKQLSGTDKEKLAAFYNDAGNAVSAAEALRKKTSARSFYIFQQSLLQATAEYGQIILKE